jgi:hypothetical protein
MSWSIGTTVKKSDGLIAGLHQLKAIDRSNIGNSDCVKERDEQIDEALGAIAQLLADPSFDNADQVSVSMAGHTNPEHKKHKEPGMSNGWVSITVSIQSYRVEES